GAVRPRSAAIVVGVEMLMFTCEMSASVPVLTDHRSTPHCARIGDAVKLKMTQRTSVIPRDALRMTRPPNSGSNSRSRGWAGSLRVVDARQGRCHLSAFEPKSGFRDSCSNFRESKPG